MPTTAVKSSVHKYAFALLALAAGPLLFAAEPAKEEANATPVAAAEAAAPVTINLGD